MFKDLLPAPVFSIGLTGHRDVAVQGSTGDAVERSVGDVFEALRRAVPPAVAQESAYFSADTPVTRLITMGAEGAELLGIRAAIRAGLEVSYVIPFSLNEYSRDFSSAAASEAMKLLAQSGALLELPGLRSEGARAYERANEIILSNIDVLVAVWNGERARGRAGTGDVVQGAVFRSIPIIVIDPEAPQTPFLLSGRSFVDSAPPAATDLDRKPLATDLSDLVHSAMRPPSSSAKRQALLDLTREAPGAAAWRREYSLLLRLLGGNPGSTRRTIMQAPDVTGDARGVSRVSLAQSDRMNALNRARTTIDELAVRYGRLFRSSSVSQYFLVIFGVWLSGVVGLLLPSLSMFSMAVQVAINGVVLVDSAFRARHRWQERWLDYRVIAEQLRWLGFRYVFGLGARQLARPDSRRIASWTDWYLERTARALGPPQGQFDLASIAAAADQLKNVEIAEQIEYHRKTFRQLGVLEKRISIGAHAALLASLAVAVLLALAAIRAGSLEAVGWRPFAIALLAALPSTMAALNGMRVEADLVRLVERSAQTVALLFRLSRSIAAAPRDYDHVSSSMQRFVSIIGNELAEWRFVIESRRSRGKRRPLTKARHTRLRSWRNAAKGSR
jgi:Protein of unknown function (DUF4231)